MRAIEVATVVRGYLSPPGPPENGLLPERWENLSTRFPPPLADSHPIGL